MWYKFTNKGRKWSQRKELEIEDYLFCAFESAGSRLKAIPVYPREGGGYYVTGGGALWGDYFADWKKNDSFYSTAVAPFTSEAETTLVLDELGLHYWETEPEFVEALKQCFAGMQIHEQEPNVKKHTL